MGGRIEGDKSVRSLILGIKDQVCLRSEALLCIHAMPIDRLLKRDRFFDR